MALRFTSLSAVELLDSRGRPTLGIHAVLTDGRAVVAGVPSGASTGSLEVRELRDGGERYSGMGVLQAVAHVNGPIAEMLVGRTWLNIDQIDSALCELDGTSDKSKLGANAIVGVSMVAARGLALEAAQPLWRWLTPTDVIPRLPVPNFNVINGGVHAPNPLEFQEFMISPLGAPTMAEAVRAGSEIYTCLRKLLSNKGYATGLGDEGGFAPDISSPEEALTLLSRAIDDAGYHAGRAGVAIALDPAASEFYTDGHYCVAGELLSSYDMIERYRVISEQFPVWSIEDGLAENDVVGWREMTSALGERVQLVGDDIFVTNAKIISELATSGVANAALIKVNQVGTVSETLAALHVCRKLGLGAMVSHRSGETTDDFIADLAVGSGCGQIKSGAPARGERVVKYNRLAQIASEAPHRLFGLPPSHSHGAREGADISNRSHERP